MRACFHLRFHCGSVENLAKFKQDAQSLCSRRGAWATGMPKQSIVNIKEPMVSHVLAKDASIIVSVIVADWNGYSCNEAFTLSKQFTQKKKTVEGWKGLFLILQWSNRLLVYMTNGNNSLIRWGLCMLDIFPKTVSSRNATKQCKRIIETSVYLRNIFWGQLIK